MSLPVGTRLPARPSAPSDPEPAMRMGELLAACRRSGMCWSNAAYRRFSLILTQDLGRTERDSWLEVFASQRGTWEAAYSRELPVRRYLDAG